jgi:hypothetical protein
MKLTNSLRDTFIRAVMDDVPETDYEAEQQRIATEWAVSIMPPKVRAVWDNKNLRHYIQTHLFAQVLSFDDIGDGQPLSITGFYIPVPNDLHPQMDEATKRALYALEVQLHSQNARRRELRNKLRTTVYALTTTTALEKALPEFTKYLPKAVSKTENLPAVANLVTDFVKAGWPKEQAA